jgi:hypothetical protein
MAKSLLSTILASTLALVACSDSTSSSENPITAGSDCTLTQGYWKNHASAWPVASVELGSVSYTEAQALAILDQPVAGNGLIALAHQLIATKLNVASGSTNTVATSIADADTLIGALVVPPVGSGYLASSQTSSLTGTLDDYNMGTTGPGHCDGTPCDPPGGGGSGSGSGGSGSGSGSGMGSGSGIF